jgi:hypothetical protein
VRQLCHHARVPRQQELQGSERIKSKVLDTRIPNSRAASRDEGRVYVQKSPISPTHPDDTVDVFVRQPGTANATLNSSDDIAGISIVKRIEIDNILHGAPVR